MTLSNRMHCVLIWQSSRSSFRLSRSAPVDLYSYMTLPCLDQYRLDNTPYCTFSQYWDAAQLLADVYIFQKNYKTSDGIPGAELKVWNLATVQNKQSIIASNFFDEAGNVRACVLYPEPRASLPISYIPTLARSINPSSSAMQPKATLDSRLKDCMSLGPYLVSRFRLSCSCLSWACLSCSIASCFSRCWIMP